MTTFVLDASVAAAAFFQEEYADQAGRLLVARNRLYAPDLIYAELANVIWKRHARHEIDLADAKSLLKDLCALPLEITPCADLVETALELALHTGRSVYDCLYLALAIRNGCAMISGDKRLLNALAATPLEKHVAWIGDLH